MFNIIIKLNNFLIKKIVKKVNPKEVMILGARCLQASFCDKKVTNDINNCVLCGKCNIKDILDIKAEYKIKNICIATGGTFARQYVRKHKPKLVIAIACERELAFGILGILPYKSYGFLLKQPCGACKDTMFNKDDFRKTLDSLLIL